MPSAAGSQMARSLRCGLTLLSLFTEEHPVRGIAELADLLDVSRPTAHRYATTCLELGYLEAAPLRRYRLARRPPQPESVAAGLSSLAPNGNQARTGRSAQARLRRGRSQSLARALAVLSCFTEHAPALGAATIARRVGLSRSTTYRYLSALRELGCLEQDTRSRYRLAPGRPELERRWT